MIVTLTTDFGLDGPYAGAVKGVLLARRPGLVLVDIAHTVAPHDVRAGAFVLAAACPWFPTGTIHLAVVDPGVGTARRPVVARGPRHLFVGPDNGLFTLLADAGEIRETRLVDPARFALGPISSTFHGRDLFAPVAAALAGGHPFEETGPAIDDPVRLAIVPPQFEEGLLRVEVLAVDAFGNVTTNLRPADLERLETASVDFPNQPGTPLVGTYGDGPRDRPFFLWGSSGYLEIAADRRSAAAQLGLRAADHLRLRPVR